MCVYVINGQILTFHKTFSGHHSSHPLLQACAGVLAKTYFS